MSTTLAAPVDPPALGACNVGSFSISIALGPTPALGTVVQQWALVEADAGVDAGALPMFTTTISVVSCADAGVGDSGLRRDASPARDAWLDATSLDATVGEERPAPSAARGCSCRAEHATGTLAARGSWHHSLPSSHDGGSGTKRHALGREWKRSSIAWPFRRARTCCASHPNGSPMRKSIVPATVLLLIGCAAAIAHEEVARAQTPPSDPSRACPERPGMQRWEQSARRLARPAAQ